MAENSALHRGRWQLAFELGAQPLQALVDQVKRLRRLVSEEQGSVDAMEQVVVDLKEQQQRHEFHLRRIESVLGKNTFLTQISRSPHLRRIGNRTGMYSS